MRVVAMAGSVSGSSVRTQKRFCGLWTGCTVGLGPVVGNREVESERRTVGCGAPWWLAREGPGLSVASRSNVTYLPAMVSPAPRSYLARWSISGSESFHTQAMGLSGKRSPPQPRTGGQSVPSPC